MKIPIPVVLVLVGLLQIAGAAAPAVTNTVQSVSQKKAPSKKPPAVKKAPAGKHVAGKAPTRKPPVAKAPTKRAPVKKAPARRVTYKPAPPVDPTDGDNVDGDDLTVRRAAVDALGTTNGSVLVVDPNSGRVLTMVNQKLGLKAGFTPCSTIKLVTALAALSEHVVERDTV